ncbi:5-(carboxyamino)imidazole ribonucleotide synthase [Sphingomonas sp.]|uniref:5-(carboxyamino)imidazole ribonucleotide synthase n=1 Tax=Sphingomonas sp. TaxID=28214 RepID=UPI00286DB962|nr:5-(carboxyamino)imidazole ribonucleotide synthase [Sphingomonas sp.]
MRIPPGSTIGIIGGGQLGRMLAGAAAELGYKCHVLAPDADPPAADVAAHCTRADYADCDALGRFADAVDVATYEFENLPADALARLGAKLRPGVASLEIAQDRAVEKDFIERTGGRVARWARVDSDDDARAAEAALGLPLVLKGRRLGYDGKGQAWAREAGSAVAAWNAIGREPAVAEAGIAFEAEFSIILARAADGATAVWDVPLNLHAEGILRRSQLPAPALVEAQADEAIATATALAAALGHVGVLTVEFFACADGPIVNEIAPRVHNSGHWTIEGAVTSQFEQHIRAICGLPLGSTRRIAPAVTMDNLIGDDVLGWEKIAADPEAKLHLYGKGAPRPGRKMGHVTRLG